MKMKKKRVIKIKGEDSSSIAIPSSSSTRKGAGLILKKRPNHPRVRFSAGRRGDGGDLEAIALPLGMSIAAIVAQVLERQQGATTETMSADYLSTICASAVTESLADVFGDTSDSFIRNFNKSFRSTLRTLRFINQSSAHKGTRLSPNLDVDYTGSSEKDNYQSPSIATNNRWNNCEEEVEENAPSMSVDRSLAIYGLANQLACVIPSTSSSANQSIISSTFEKSFLEQFTRSNDLTERKIGLRKAEMGLTRQMMDLGKAQVAVNADSNHLAGLKLVIDAEIFKNQVEETRHGELQRNCVDYLVAGMFVMSSSLLYGAYVFAYDRITQATETCFPSPEESKSSWWMPKPISTFNSGISSVKCHVEVGMRMSFGVLMILTMAYLVLQRSMTKQQTMPITLILVLLGGACGVAGKLCVDTLGGNGYSWLIHWELLCSIHFLSNVWTSVLFFILYGPVNVVPGRMKCSSTMLFPYWIRRLSFYSIVVLLLPLLCGFSPFASIGEWKDHFKLLLYDFATSEDSGLIFESEL